MLKHRGTRSKCVLLDRPNITNSVCTQYVRQDVVALLHYYRAVIIQVSYKLGKLLKFTYVFY